MRKTPYLVPALLLTWGATLSLPAVAGKVINAKIEHHDGHFSAYTELLIYVSEPRVRAILTRYENLPRVNPGIQAVRILRRGPGDQVRMKVDASGCILFVCLDYSWVQDARTLPSGDILTVMDPTQSDFHQGRVLYRMVPRDDYTELTMDAEVVPSFWFPPLIGPWLIKQKLRNEALETADAIEQIAAEQQSSTATD